MQWENPKLMIVILNKNRSSIINGPPILHYCPSQMNFSLLGQGVTMICSTVYIDPTGGGYGCGELLEGDGGP